MRMLALKPLDEALDHRSREFVELDDLYTIQGYEYLKPIGVNLFKYINYSRNTKSVKKISKNNMIDIVYEHIKIFFKANDHIIKKTKVNTYAFKKGNNYILRFRFPEDSSSNYFDYIDLWDLYTNQEDIEFIPSGTLKGIVKKEIEKGTPIKKMLKKIDNTPDDKVYLTGLFNNLPNVEKLSKAFSFLLYIHQFQTSVYIQSSTVDIYYLKIPIQMEKTKIDEMLWKDDLPRITKNPRIKLCQRCLIANDYYPIV